MAPRTTISRFSFLKEALVLPARNPMFFAPLLIYAVASFHVTSVKLVYIGPLTREMSRHITEMEEHTDPSSAEYAGLLEEVRQEARELLLINIEIALVLLTLAFPRQIVTCFTTYFRDRYSLTEILHQVVKYVKGPLIAIAVVTMLQVTSIAILGAYIDAVSDSWVICVLSALVFVSYTALLWFGDAGMVIVAASAVVNVEVAITPKGDGRRGMRGLGEAWRLITQVRTKEGFVLVLVTLLLPTVLIPLYALALLCTKQSTGLGLALCADRYTLLSAVHGMYYIRAACAHTSQGYHSLAMESKEAAEAWDDYVHISFREASI